MRQAATRQILQNAALDPQPSHGTASRVSQGEGVSLLERNVQLHAAAHCDRWLRLHALPASLPRVLIVSSLLHIFTLTLSRAVALAESLQGQSCCASPPSGFTAQDANERGREYECSGEQGAVNSSACAAAKEAAVQSSTSPDLGIADGDGGAVPSLATPVQARVPRARCPCVCVSVGGAIRRPVEEAVQVQVGHNEHA